MSEVLSLSAISRSYATSHGPLEVLRHANLSLSRGELVALIGPSGSGKSTLLHIAGLLDSPQSGSIHIAGVDASHANDAVRTRLRNQHIGFIYQFHNLQPEFNICTTPGIKVGTQLAKQFSPHELDELEVARGNEIG